MAILDSLLDRIGQRLAMRITDAPKREQAVPPPAYDLLVRHLQPGDVLLVETGPSKVSAAIKYLTQSNWSHAALYIGDALGKSDAEGLPLCLVEAEVGHGVIASPLSKYAANHVRICRPVSLSEPDRKRVIRYAMKRIGDKYDLRNILDLVRYLLPQPPVPSAWRRRMITFGSGSPTRAICSTLIAKAFEKIKYPVLPMIEYQGSPEHLSEVMRARHYTLHVPRDFDVSPYFAVVKPTLEDGFDYKALRWAEEAGDGAAHPAP